MCARLKRAAHGLNDALRLWWNRLDKQLRHYALVPTRADRCCYVLYAKSKTVSPFLNRVVLMTRQHMILQVGRQGLTLRSRFLSTRRVQFRNMCVLSSITSLRGSKNPVKALQHLDLDGAPELLLDPIAGSNARGMRVRGIVTVHVDDACLTGDNVFVKTVVEGLRLDFKVGSEDKMMLCLLTKEPVGSTES